MLARFLRRDETGWRYSLFMVALAILSWATLAALVTVFLRMAMRPDAGFGAGGPGRSRRPGSRPPHRERPPISPSHDAAWAALRR